MHHRYEPGISWVEAWRLALAVPLERRSQYKLARLALERYDLPGADLSLLAAAGNWVFLVDQAGHAMALRISAPGSRTMEQVQAELAFTEDLRTQLGIRTPRPIPGRDGRTIQTVSADDGTARPVVLFTWMSGHPFGYRPTTDQMELLGRCQARMHDFALSASPSYARDRHELSAATVLEWTDIPAKAELVLTEKDRVLVAEMAVRLRAWVPTLFQRSPQALVHFDLTGGNVLLDGDELGIIDLDDCLNAPVVLDLATALTYTSAKAEATALREAFLKGHASVHGLASEFVDLLDPAIGLIALREIRRVLARPRITAEPSGPVVLMESLQVLRATALRMGVLTSP
jgi:Ser/Thr protein kinase RdoA (MazF antagonist)